MTEKKRSLSISKLGKLFGVSSTNLSQMGATAPNSASNTSLSSTVTDPLLLRPQVHLNAHQPAARLASPSFMAQPASPSSPEMSEASDTAMMGMKPVKLTVNNSTKSPSLSPVSSQTDLMQPRPIHPEIPAKYIRSPPTLRSNSIKRNGSQTNIARSNTSTPAPKPRFKMLENSSHEHNLRSAKRQEKLSNMLKDLLGAKKLRDEAKLALPNITETDEPNQPPTLFAGLVSQVKSYAGESVAPNTSNDCRSFVEKYGRCQEVIGKGSYGVVRISHKRANDNDFDSLGNEVLYAVKEFKKKANELERKYNRRLTSEFCISSSLKHLNIIQTLDLLKDAKGDFVEVMEFCSGGDLYTLIIANGKLEYAEADCFFKQLIKGVNYMHDMGVAHRDLKPENILLTQNGVLKITDFGNSECFKMAWEDNIQYSEGVCGSSPYIAPEEFTSSSFDPRCVDIWSCGVIYMAMRTGRQLWSVANLEDEFFQEYLIKRKNLTGYEPIENLKRARCRNVIYSILDPKPSRRITGKQILNSEWGREIKLCEAAQGLLNTTEQI